METRQENCSSVKVYAEVGNSKVFVYYEVVNLTEIVSVLGKSTWWVTCVVACSIFVCYIRLCLRPSGWCYLREEV